MSLEVNPGMFLDEAPPRIIGTECEYDIQNRSKKGHIIPLEVYMSFNSVVKAGLRIVDKHLTNGAKLYRDDNSLELASAESLGPKQAAAADLAGIIVMKQIVGASRAPHQGLFRHAGTFIDKKFSNKADDYETAAVETRGYHENYMFPRSIETDELIKQLMPSHLASRLWAMAGAVDNGFMFSQKAPGVGGDTVSDTRMTQRRVHHGGKPMYSIPAIQEDFDVLCDSGWARLEVRFADPGQSPTARYLSLASTSLVLRLLEHKDIVGENRLRKLSLQDPVAAAIQFSEDLSLTSTVKTVDGENLTALDIQEELCELEYGLSQEMQLPDDEVEAITRLRDIIDKMRKSNPENAEYGDLIYVWDAAAKHNYLSHSMPQMVQHRGNPDAIYKSFIWDRVLPEGGATKWWDKFGNDVISKDDIAKLVLGTPSTVASIRAHRIQRNSAKIESVHWSSIEYKNGPNDYFANPYATQQ